MVCQTTTTRTKSLNNSGDVLTDLLAAFEALPKPPVFKLTTEPVRRVLEAVGRPQDRLPPVIHIAGTNGKGSTTAFMRAITEAHGLKAHVDTSPHLIRVNERIRIAGELISDEALRSYAERVLEANAGQPMSFFEGMTVVAYLAFADAPADVTLVEVGLGGRFDCTNVFDKTACSVITPIDFDHRDFLGRHLCQIAWEKAGIIKPDSPVVSANQQSEVERTLRAEARFQGAPFTALSEVSDVSVGAEGITFEIDGMTVGPADLSLEGPHQLSNAALAILALKRSGAFKLKSECVKAGLKSAVWPARLQKLADGPLTALLPGKTVMLDGGHNPHAAAALRRALEPHSPIPAAMAMLRTKDAESYLKELAPVIGHLAVLPMTSDKNGHDPKHLERCAQKLGISVSVHDTIEDSLNRLSQEKSDHALICGSLYLAGDVLAENGEIID
ncbi:MAG: bifunctional folylpolyglutamate synthase/dihydrofolate synthase [Ponticaulis sp.]|nr:bifunctional folylpolyglutamate synthase/dihydrofolate synthase [Ponticaulis sp.]